MTLMILITFKLHRLTKRLINISKGQEDWDNSNHTQDYNILNYSIQLSTHPNSFYTRIVGYSGFYQSNFILNHSILKTSSNHRSRLNPLNPLNCSIYSAKHFQIGSWTWITGARSV